MKSMLLRASCTWDWAAAVLDRATSSLRLLVSSLSLPFIWSRPCLSLSTTSVCEAMLGSAALASFSEAIWRCRATLARLSNFSASATSPLARYSSALRDAARALLPQSWAFRMSSL